MQFAEVDPKDAFVPWEVVPPRYVAVDQRAAGARDRAAGVGTRRRRGPKPWTPRYIFRWVTVPASTRRATRRLTGTYGCWVGWATGPQGAPFTFDHISWMGTVEPFTSCTSSITFPRFDPASVIGMSPISPPFCEYHPRSA